MSKSKKQRDSIPEVFTSIEEAANFWDIHSTVDYDDLMHDVHFDVDIQRRTVLVPIEGSVAEEIMTIARQEGLLLDNLVNLWLREKLVERGNLS
ncbi:MAG: CopG family antitoxin [Candidatus Eremiobacterota bacterium]